VKKDADLSTSTDVIPELASIYTAVSFAEMKWTLHNVKQWIESGLGLNLKPRPLPRDQDRYLDTRSSNQDQEL